MRASGALVLLLSTVSAAAQTDPPVPPVPPDAVRVSDAPESAPAAPHAAPAEPVAEGVEPVPVATAPAVDAAEASVPAAQDDAAAPAGNTVAPAAGTVQADPPAPESDATPDPWALQVHGFVSPGFIVTTKHNYLAESDRGSFEFTEVGINFTKQLSDELRVGVQLFSRDLGQVGNYKITADWFYLDYRLADWLGVRAGRVKIPFGLYNEISDIDPARTQILLPQSVYPIENRDFLLALTGVEIYGYLDLDAAGALDYRLFGGTMFLDADSGSSTGPEVLNLSVPYIAGGRLLWETPLQGLRAGGSVQFLRLETDLLFDDSQWTPLQMAGELPASFDGIVSAKIPALMWVGSIEYAAHDLLLAAEYSRWHVKLESSEPVLFPESETTSERLYGLVAYRLTTWFRPGVYYSLYFPDADDRDGSEAAAKAMDPGRDGRAAVQHDAALSLRFDVNAHLLFKLEGHYMNGTAVLKRDLNDGTPAWQLDRSWGLFLAKTSAYF